MPEVGRMPFSTPPPHLGLEIHASERCSLPFFFPCRQESEWLQLQVDLLGCVKVQEPEQEGRAWSCVGPSSALATREWQAWGMRTEHLSHGAVPQGPLGPSGATFIWKGTLQPPSADCKL